MKDQHIENLSNETQRLESEKNEKVKELETKIENQTAQIQKLNHDISEGNLKVYLKE